MMSIIELCVNTGPIQRKETGKDTNPREVRAVLFPVLGKQSQEDPDLAHWAVSSRCTNGTSGQICDFEQNDNVRAS